MRIPVLEPRALHLWLLHLDEVYGLAAREAGLLPPEEQQRAQRMPGPARDRYLATRVALRRLLCAYTGAPAPLLRFRIGAEGKPHLPPPWSGVQFNISHSGAWSLLAFRAHEPVGVDVERIRSGTPVLPIARRFFTAPEADAIDAAGPEDGRALFFRLWTRKEALVKARGSAMLLEAGRFTLPLSEEPAELAMDGRTWHVCEPRIAPGYAAALATPVPAPELLSMDYPSETLKA